MYIKGWYYPQNSPFWKIVTIGTLFSGLDLGLHMMTRHGSTPELPQNCCHDFFLILSTLMICAVGNGWRRELRHLRCGPHMALGDRNEGSRRWGFIELTFTTAHCTISLRVSFSLKSLKTELRRIPKKAFRVSSRVLQRVLFIHLTGLVSFQWTSCSFPQSRSN